MVSLKNSVYCNQYVACILPHLSYFDHTKVYCPYFHAGSDFNVTVFDFSFVGGAAPEIIAAARLPAIDDTLPELTEGFLYYLEVVNNQLHPRDVGRIDFFNQFTLVQIEDNDCESQFIGLYPILFILPVVLCM